MMGDESIYPYPKKPTPFKVGDKVRLNTARYDWEDLADYGLHSDITYEVFEVDQQLGVRVRVGGTEVDGLWWPDRFLLAPEIQRAAKPVNDAVVRAARKLYERGDYPEAAALLLTLHE